MRILIVEDEMLVGNADRRSSAGTGPSTGRACMRLEPALEQAATADIDMAILDINLAENAHFRLPIA